MSKTMSKTTTKKERCCFAGCRTLIRDYGNNPRPCYTSGRCCDHCNIKVIEERWNAIQKSIASPPHIMVHVDGNSVQNVDDTFFDPLDELWERVPGRSPRCGHTALRPEASAVLKHGARC